MKPVLIYGTAWKEDATAQLVGAALDAGFRAIDTANQRKHYHEAGVGEAIKASKLKRDELWLQTKFTYLNGQDHRLPYDPKASFADQVRQSFASSLEHLGVDYIDSYVLHGPSMRRGLSDADFETWEALEGLHRSGKAKALGVSNVSVSQLEELYDTAAIKPAAVQNRCFAVNGWDYDVREFCKANQLTYQGFSLLTANVEEIQQPQVIQIAQRHRKTLPQVIFRFCHQIGMTILTGTTSPQHMKEDLAITDFELTNDEVQLLENVAL